MASIVGLIWSLRFKRFVRENPHSSRVTPSSFEEQLALNGCRDPNAPGGVIVGPKFMLHFSSFRPGGLCQYLPECHRLGSIVAPLLPV